MSRVRPFRDEDAETLSHLFFFSIHQIASRHYSPEQIQAWAPASPDPAFFRRRAVDGRALLVVAGADDQPLAYGDVEANGHIDHFFCHPEHTRSIVALALYDALEATAVGRGIRRLFVEASEPARRFFDRRGFSVIERWDFAIRGVMIHNYRMEKLLT